MKKLIFLVIYSLLSINVLANESKTSVNSFCSFSECSTQICKDGDCVDVVDVSEAKFLSNSNFVSLLFKDGSAMFYCWTHNEFIELEELEKECPNCATEFSKIQTLSALDEGLKESCERAFVDKYEEQCFNMVKTVSEEYIDIAINFVKSCDNAFTSPKNSLECINLGLIQSNSSLSIAKVDTCDDHFVFDDEVLSCVKISSSSFSKTEDIPKCREKNDEEDALVCMKNINSVRATKSRSN